jgi:excisionase family DNA binding protein
MTTEPTQTWTVTEASAALGVSDRTVRNWCAAGELDAVQSGTGQWTIRELTRRVALAVTQVDPSPAERRATDPLGGSHSADSGAADSGDLVAAFELVALRSELTEARLQSELWRDRAKRLTADNHRLADEAARNRRQMAAVLRQAATMYDDADTGDAPRNSSVD